MNYSYTRDGKVRLPSGIVIGRAFIPPPAPIYSEAARIQAGLLRKRKPVLLADVLTACAVGAAFAVILFFGLSQ